MSKVPNKIAILSLLTAALSGCFADPHDHSAHDHGDEAGDETGHEAGHDPNASGDAPMIMATVLLNGTELSLENGSYAVPVGESVTFDASASHDMDGGDVTFLWDLGAGTTDTAPILEHAFPEMGNFSIFLVVTDDENMSSNQTFPVVVIKAGPAPGTFIRDEKKTFSGTITAAVQTPVGEACATYGTGASFTHEWTISAEEPDGTATLVSHFVLLLTGSANTNRDTDIYFYDPAGKEVGKGVGSSATETIDVEGSFGPGKYVVKVVGCTAVNATYSVDATATYVAA